MDYRCEVCNMFIKPKSKSKHFKSKNHKYLDKQKHIKITIDNPNIKNIDEIFYSHIIEYNNKYEFYFVRCNFKLCFINRESYGIACSNLTDNKTMVSWKNFLENKINNLKNEGYDFSHISEMNIIIVCNKMYMTYDFYMKHNMPAVEWKINQLFNKDKKLINKFPLSWIHPLNRKFKSYRV